VKNILQAVIKYAKVNNSLKNIEEIHRISVRTSQKTRRVHVAKKKKKKKWGKQILMVIIKKEKKKK